MPKIFRPKGSAKYVLFFTDETGKRKKKTLETDKGVSERIARDLLNKVVLRKNGFLDERDEKLAEHKARPLKEHIADFCRFVASDGATEKHVRGVEMRIQRVLTLAKIKRISDLSLVDVQEALTQLRKIRSTGTLNTYIRDLKAFSRWLWKDKRAREHCLLDLETKDAKNDRRRVRRRMPDDEAMRVIQAAQNGPKRGNLSGPDRAMLYRLAHGTGFRAKELRTITPESFRLNDDPPTVKVLACYTKNRQEAIQPIAMGLADLLRPWLARKAPGRPVFERLVHDTAKMLRFDLAAAGVPYIVDGEYNDFHASRGTYVSNLVASGASVKTCQTLARHADPALTIGIYAKASLHDIHGAVENLPDLTAKPAQIEVLSATGTDGQGATQSATSVDEQGEIDERKAFIGGSLRRENAAVVSVRGKRYDPCPGRRA